MPAVAHLIVSLPPGIDGIRDYAVRLAEGLRTLGIESEFLAARGDGPRTARLNGFPARGLARRDAGLLARELAGSGAREVLLHQSGYGYAPRGAPFWLLGGLARWKAADPRRRLVVMFHELWTTGAPWRSSFWMGPLQRSVVNGILRLADSFLTNTERHAAWLERLAPDRRPVAVLPVLSNIGEPREPPPFEDREPAAVVFGQPGMRARAYAALGKFLAPLRDVGIERIFDVGPPLDECARAACPMPVTRVGYLEDAGASEVMLRCRFGLLEYPLDFLAKSGILAAYAAHGVVPLVRSPVTGTHDGLRHGTTLVCLGAPIEGRLADAGPRIARAVHSWYAQHALEPTAAAFARALHADRAPR
jgi:hypothetical protein